MNEVAFEKLYDHYYKAAVLAARSDIDASLYAYETASSDMRSMNKAELKAYMKEIGC